MRKFPSSMNIYEANLPLIKLSLKQAFLEKEGDAICVEEEEEDDLEPLSSRGKLVVGELVQRRLC